MELSIFITKYIVVHALADGYNNVTGFVDVRLPADISLVDFLIYVVFSYAINFTFFAVIINTVPLQM